MFSFFVGPQQANHCVGRHRGQGNNIDGKFRWQCLYPYQCLAGRRLQQDVISIIFIYKLIVISKDSQEDSLLEAMWIPGMQHLYAHLLFSMFRCIHNVVLLNKVTHSFRACIYLASHLKGVIEKCRQLKKKSEANTGGCFMWFCSLSRVWVMTQRKTCLEFVAW